MSNKTIKSRIAKVAITAILGGSLAVVSAPFANAADDDFHIGLTASVTGSGTASATVGSMRQVGFVTLTNNPGTANGTTSYSVDDSEAATGVVLSGAVIPFLVEGNTTNGTGISIVVTGGVLSDLDQTVNDLAGGNDPVVNGARTTAVYVQQNTTAAKLIGLVTANAAVGSTMTLAAYSGTGVDGVSTATSGSLLGTYTFTVASASVAGTYSASQSDIWVQEPLAKGTAATATETYDSTTKIDNGKVGVIWFDLEDAYTSAITTGTLTATATGGSFVNVVDSAAAGDAYAATAAFDSTTPDAAGNGWIYVTQPVSNTAGSTTVTVTYNGTVIATKTMSWLGDIASIAVDTANSSGIFATASGEADSANQLSIYYVVKDAAGNVINLASTNKPTITGATGAFVGATLSSSNATTLSTLQTNSLGYGVSTIIIPDTELRGSGTFKLRVTNASGANIDSAAVTMSVSSDTLDSFTASWDKATYTPGEIATLTITGKDAGGRAIYDGAAATSVALIAPSGFTSVGAACGEAKVFVSGTYTCKYTAGNTAGSYGWSYDVPTGTPQSATVGTLTIKTSAISNEEVLAAIVKLIASINKQISLLQKQLKKK